MAASEPAAALGYRMPAEWAAHRGTWLSWPHNRDTWPGGFDAVEPIMTAAVAALARSERVHVNVLDGAHEAHVRALLATVPVGGAVLYHHIPTNDAWCRDHGALFVVADDASAPLAAVDFRFNSWGGKYPPWDLDDAAARHMADSLGVPCFRSEMILEGGSIDVNGAGTLLTTEQCLLNPNRNPGMTRVEIEAALRCLLGVESVIWLGEGIAGDDTDGHVDDITRFVAEDTVVTVVEPDREDENHAPLAENLERLRAARLADGRPLNVIELPMPGPVHRDGQRLPASYANFYVANRVVLLPCYRHANDEVARETLARCFPDREIVGIDCTDLVWGLGAFHCLTQQVPSP